MGRYFLGTGKVPVAMDREQKEREWSCPRRVYTLSGKQVKILEQSKGTKRRIATKEKHSKCMSRGPALVFQVRESFLRDISAETEGM